ncbi:hypothetical protein [Candidatus Ichthyocystis hellenicum]|uniref:hypothetical protein n=1 Tax=Candidatus Ichthyocystis hellenicum TaxID=1561003 RepID=UPI0011122037|nr:hypothetical protein [Candidatus Ichthyocystis hellenicum]
MNEYRNRNFLAPKKLTHGNRVNANRYYSVIASGLVATCFLANTVTASTHENNNFPEYEANEELIIDSTGDSSGPYKLDIINEDYTYPRRWNPFRTGSCHPESKQMHGMLRVLYDGKRLAVMESSYPWAARKSFFLGAPGKLQAYWLATMGCNGEIMLFNGPWSYTRMCATLSSQPGRVELIFMEDESKCEHFSYHPVKERTCAGVIERSVYPGEKNVYRLYRPWLSTDAVFKYREVIDENRAVVEDGETFDFSSKGGYGYFYDRVAREGLGSLFSQSKIYKYPFNNPGFGCYERPLVNNGGATLGELGETSNKSCANQDGCKWITVGNADSNFYPASGTGFWVEVADKIGMSGTTKVQIRNDGALIRNDQTTSVHSSDHFWYLLYGSRVVTDDGKCVTSTRDGDDMRLEECDSAGEGRFYVPARLSMPDRRYTAVEVFPYNVIIRPCVKLNDSGDIVAEEGITPDDVAANICKKPYPETQEAQHSKVSR